MEEIWKPITEYEGFYSVSNLGQVKRHTLKVKCARGFRTVNERILKKGKDKNRYSLIALTKFGKTKTYRLARIVAQEFIENPENKPQINHKDGIKSNDFSINLEWVTNSENVIHAHATGLRIGETPHNCKITRQQVDSIRLECLNVTKTELATKYGISRKHIYAIINGMRWK